MAASNYIEFSQIENVLPPELIEKILKLLGYKDICQAQLSCRRWREIVGMGNLVNLAKGKKDSND